MIPKAELLLSLTAEFSIHLKMMEDDVTMEVFYQAESRPPRAAVRSYIWPAQGRVSMRLCPQGTHSIWVL